MDKVISNYQYPIASDSWRYLPKDWRKGKLYSAIYTGEKRCPKRGEWFFSGAIVEAYYAMNDLTTPYHIAQIVR